MLLGMRKKIALPRRGVDEKLEPLCFTKAIQLRKVYKVVVIHICIIYTGTVRANRRNKYKTFREKNCPLKQKYVSPNTQVMLPIILLNILHRSNNQLDLA